MSPAPATAPSGPIRRWQLPRIDPDDRWIGGVAAAIARELGVEALVIRVSFVVLSLAGGWGLAFYAIAWLVLAVAQPRQLAPYRPSPKASSPFHRYLAVAMVVLGLLLALRRVAFFVDEIVFPAAFVVTGFLVAWTRHRDEDGVSAVVRILVGVVIGASGMIAFATLSSTNVVDALFVLITAVAIVAGIGLVATPSLARIGHDLDEERQSRVRADERARVAAHLHDSVLQTLALIQRHADDPVRTAQLARHQERELRSWLFGSGDQSPPGTVRLGLALEEMAAEVDAAHGVPVKTIVVGDSSDLEPGAIDALVAAAKEATVNAAKHSGAKRVDVFAERSRDQVEIFVRDTGRGFDPTSTATDRQGIVESIVGRMDRAGGRAAVHTEIGGGTEVELVLPIEVAAEPEATPDLGVQSPQPAAPAPVRTDEKEEQHR